MKKIVAAVCCALFTSTLFAQVNIFSLMERRDLKLSEIDSIANKHFGIVGTQKGSDYTHYQRWRFEQQFHLNDAGYIKPPEEEHAAFKTAIAAMQSRVNNTSWIEKGPQSWNSTSGWNPGVGRLTCIGITSIDTTVIYVGSPGGGIWKSTNSGASWTPLSDNASNRMNVTAITVDPTNTSNVFAASNGSVFKSINGGATWVTLSGVTGTVHKFLVQPNNVNIVFAASTSGIFRSINGGTFWSRVSTITTQDIEFKPQDVNIMYATGSGTNSVLRSTDNGVTWTTIGSSAGITNTGRTLVSVSAANANMVYVAQANGDVFGQLYRSTDAGLTFTTQVVGNATNGTNYFGYETTGRGTTGQASYDMAMCVSPVNANEIYIAGIICWKSTNGGTSFIPLTAWFSPNSIGYNHADVHTLDWVKNTIYSSSDGGIYKTLDLGDNWIDLTKGLGIRQFYRIDCSQTNASFYGGGSQDNGSSINTPTGWIDWLGADGMEMEFSYTNHLVVYGTSQNGKLYRSVNGGLSYANLTQASNGDWVTPFAVHPTNDSIVFIGWAGVFKSVNRGNSWVKISNNTINNTLACLTLSLSDTNYIYASNTNNLYVTTDGGTTWATRAAPANITSICVHPTIPTKIWITTSSSGSSRIMVSTNGGQTFASIAGTLPSLSARTVVIDKNDPKETLYIGMNTGVYYRSNDMADWAPFLTGLPLVAVNELDIQQSSKKIRVGTYGRGLWENDLITNTALPVKWLLFTGKKTNLGNQLNWQVLENNFTDKYELEYSSNGVQFTTIKTIDASTKLNGQTSATANYLHTYNTSGSAYYRIKQFDKNGSIFYSNLVFVKNANSNELIVFPNPVKNTLQIQLPGNLNNTKPIAQVFNTNGILLLQQAPTSNNFVLNMSNFSSGQYVLLVTVNNNVYKQLFIKQ